MTRRSLTIAVTLLALCALTTCAQDAKAPPSEPSVVLTKLGPITYPLIARTANISGDVEVVVKISRDGTVESATAVSGPPLLYRAAVQNVEQSQFECRRCTTGITASRVVYLFQLTGQDKCCSNSSDAEVSKSGNKVVVIGQAFCFCDPPAILGKRRSWRCLYLWHCAR